MRSTKLIFFLIVLFISLVISCKRESIEKPVADFTIDGLSGLTVRQIRHFDDELFAVTNQGLFRKNLSGGTGWQSVGLTEYHLGTFVKIAQNYWLAVSYDYVAALSGYPVFLSVNQGGDWTIFSNDFGGEYGERINDFEWNAASGKLYAAGANVVAESSNQGVNWTPLVGEWGALATGLSVVRLSEDKSQLWAGGQNAIEGLSLYRYDLASQEQQQWLDLIPSPSVVKKLLFDPNDHDHLLLGGEGGVIESHNNGDTWQSLITREDSKFYFGLAFDHSNVSTIYAAGWIKQYDTPQPLILSYSKNGGQSWSDVQFGDDQLYGGVWSMVSVMEGENQVLYLGLQGGGIARILIINASE